MAVRNLSYFYLFCWQGFYIVFGQIFQEGPDDDSMVGLGILLQGLSAAILLAIEVKPVIPYEAWSDVGRVPEAFFLEKVFQNKLVIIEGAARTVHFYLQMLEELFREPLDLGFGCLEMLHTLCDVIVA